MLLIAIACAACGTSASGGGGDDDPSPDAGAGDGGGADGGGAAYTELIGGTWELEAGDEGYYCVTRTLAQDTWITGFTNTAPPGTHHTALSVGDPIGPDGSAPCGATDNRETIIYGAGVGTPELLMPTGYAVRVRAGQQLLLNLHIFNGSDFPLSGHSGVSITTTTASVAELGVAQTGRTSGLMVPPGTSTQVGTCDVPADAVAFSVFPHMHQLGVHLRGVLTTDDGPVTLLDMPYSFDSQRYYEISQVELSAGDEIRVECGYANNTGSTVYFGQSSFEEMCGLAIYISPPWDDPFCGF